jgi:protein-S-isoprenylcysteine O-methyltransferase Ste14
MKVVGILGRGLLALIGLLAAASVVGGVYLVALHRLALSAELVCGIMWDAWVASWIAAMVWSRPATARPSPFNRWIYWLLPTVGACLLAFGSIKTHFTPLWVTPDVMGWAMAGLCGAGLLFTWWARIALGSLWSGSVSLKEGHAVIQTGPYRLVRHPIYTGIIIAALAQGIVIGQAANLIGALVIAFGFWLKAGFEEQFLSQELGPATYSEYRRRTPMLAPFWPIRR